MPKIHVSGKDSKTPNRRFMQYDPTIKGDLPSTEAQASYDRLKAHTDGAKVETAKLTKIMQDCAKAQGCEFIPAVFVKWEKVSVAVDDGSSASKTTSPMLKQPDKSMWAAFAKAD